MASEIDPSGIRNHNPIVAFATPRTGKNVKGSANKFHLVRFIAFALCGCALLWGGWVHAQAAAPEATGDAVARMVQAFYDQTRSIQADFHQTYFNKLYGTYDRSHGQVKFQKPGKMRWDYAAPNGKVIASDGQHLVIYEPGEEQNDPGQVFERPVADSELMSALAFLTGNGKLADDFTFRLLDAAKQGFTGGYVLELMPKKPNPNFERILFYVDGDPARLGLVHRVLIVDGSGNRNRFDFQKPKFNQAIEAKAFAYQAPKNARKVKP
jgi:outer membrane lipoprotein carrier protein